MREILTKHELKTIVRVCEILTKQTKDNRQSARDTSETKDNRQSARDTNETNELKKIVRVREILTKQTN